MSKNETLNKDGNLDVKKNIFLLSGLVCSNPSCVKLTCSESDEGFYFSVGATHT